MKNLLQEFLCILMIQRCVPDIGFQDEVRINHHSALATGHMGIKGK